MAWCWGIWLVSFLIYPGLIPGSHHAIYVVTGDQQWISSTCPWFWVLASKANLRSSNLSTMTKGQKVTCMQLSAMLLYHLIRCLSILNLIDRQPVRPCDHILVIHPAHASSLHCRWTLINNVIPLVMQQIAGCSFCRMWASEALKPLTYLFHLLLLFFFSIQWSSLSSSLWI